MARHTNLSRPPDPTEDDIQAAFVQVCRLNAKEHRELRMLYSIPNAARRSMMEAMKMKRTGLEAGVPDLNLDVARGGFHGLRLEFKRGSKGRLSDEQAHWHEDLIEEGYFVAVVRSCGEAEEVTARYLQKTKDVLFRERPKSANGW